MRHEKTTVEHLKTLMGQEKTTVEDLVRIREEYEKSTDGIRGDYGWLTEHLKTLTEHCSAQNDTVEKKTSSPLLKTTLYSIESI